MPKPLCSGSELYLTEVSPNDKPWDEHRAIAEKVGELYSSSDLKSYAERISRCSLLLGFGLEQECTTETLKLKLQTAQFCRVRHCPVCQWRRSSMWRARFFNALPKVIEAYPSARWVFLTLTVQNCPLDELRDTLRSMNKAWERLSKRKRFPAIGWVKSVEVTRAANDMAHPHFHCLLMVKPSYFSHGYINQAEWTELWKSALKVDYTPIVNVKAVKDRRRSARTGGEGEGVDQVNQGLIVGILETLKYSVKPADLAGLTNEANREVNARWLATLTEQLHKTRAIAVGGVLKEFIQEEEPEDLIHAEGEEVDLTEDDLLIWFGWREMAKRYAKQER